METSSSSRRSSRWNQGSLATPHSASSVDGSYSNNYYPHRSQRAHSATYSTRDGTSSGRRPRTRSERSYGRRKNSSYSREGQQHDLTIFTVIILFSFVVLIPAALSLFIFVTQYFVLWYLLLAQLLLSFWWILRELKISKQHAPQPKPSGTASERSFRSDHNTRPDLTLHATLSRNNSGQVAGSELSHSVSSSSVPNFNAIVAPAAAAVPPVVVTKTATPPATPPASSPTTPRIVAPPVAPATPGSAVNFANMDSILDVVHDGYFNAEEREFQLEHPSQLAPTAVRSKTRWKLGEKIGQGAFGVVFTGLNEDTGELMAVKQITIKTNENMIAELEKEVELMTSLHHANIVQYLGTSRDTKFLNIFLEYVSGGSIMSLLSKFGGKFNEQVASRYTRQILMGLQYLHRHQIIHRDIKGANILVDRDGQVKLADFGAAKRLGDLITPDQNGPAARGPPTVPLVGTLCFMAPEVARQTGHYGRQADIWSLGCTVLQMLTGAPPYADLEPVPALYRICASGEPPPLPSDISANCMGFLLACFQRDPKERPTATTLLRHPWVTPPRNNSNRRNQSSASDY